MSQDLKDLQTGPVLTLDPFQDTKQEIKPEFRLCWLLLLWL